MKKHVKKIKSLLKKKRHHIGYTTSAVLFLSIGALLAQNDSIQFTTGVADEPIIEETEMFPEDIVDPREIDNALREIGRLKGEARGLLKRVSRIKNDELKQRLSEIISQLDAFYANIKNPTADYTAREALMEFYDARMWDEVSKIRGEIELPQILKDIPLAIRRIEKLLKLKAYKTLGLDMQGIANYLNEVKIAREEANRLYVSGDIEGAMEELQFMQEGGHPGELEGAIRRLKEINDLIKRVKDKAIQKELSDMLLPITEAVNEGDFRTAHEILNDIHPFAADIARKAYKANAKSRSDIMKRLLEFEGKVNSKLEEKEAERLRQEEQMRMKEEEEQMRMLKENEMMPQQMPETMPISQDGTVSQPTTEPPSPPPAPASETFNNSTSDTY